MRKTAIAVTLLLSLMLLPLYAAAETDSSTTHSDLAFAIDGSLYTHPPNEPAPYINTDQRTMVPASFFAAAMGVPASGVKWDAAAKTATIEHEGQQVRMKLGQSSIWVNDTEVKIDSSIQIKNGRIFIPVRFIVEGLGAHIQWDPYNRIAHISTAGVTLSPEAAQAAIGQQADEILNLLADRNIAALADKVHPDRGLRFSPYSYVDIENHLRFSPAELEAAVDSEEELLWGTYDGSGEPLKLSFADYFSDFVFSHDFRQVPQVSYNEQIFSGNSINNAPVVYGGAIIVEYHFDGFEEQYAGLDWRSLRLVFQPYNEEWRLVGIINDQWTT